MAISKRLRFEILRRDEFRCTYCGATPREAELEVDHVIPEALGGQTTVENLTTACAECNSGKTSTSPDAAIVDALNLAVAAEQAARVRIEAIMQTNIDAINDYEDEVQSVWDSYVPQFRRAAVRWSISQISDWHANRVPIDLVEFGLRVALDANVPWASKAAYAAGVIRNRVQEARDADQIDQA